MSIDSQNFLLERNNRKSFTKNIRVLGIVFVLYIRVLGIVFVLCDTDYPTPNATFSWSETSELETFALIPKQCCISLTNQHSRNLRT